MNKDDYIKYFTHEKLNSDVFNSFLPALIVLLLFLLLSKNQNFQFSGILFLLLPISYLPIFWIYYYVLPFGMTIPKSSKFFFDKIGYEKLSIRYAVLKKIYDKWVRFLIYSIAFSAIVWYFTSLIQNQNANFWMNLHGFLIAIALLPGTMIFSMRVVIGFMQKYEDYYFYLSKGCFRIAHNLEGLDELHQSAWVVNGLYSYNKYIRKNVTLHINNLEIMYSKIISTSNKSMNELLQTILDKLESSERLGLLRYLLSLDDTNSNKMSFSYRGFRARMKDTLPFVIPVISVIFTALELMKK